MRKLLAFLARGYQIESSYKLAVFFQLGSVLVPILTLYFAGRLVDSARPAALAHYGGRYSQFLIIGLALTQYYAQALRISAESLRRAQLSGVLEAILSTRTRPAALVLYDAAFAFLAASLNLLLILGVGGLVLGLNFRGANFVGVLAAVILGGAAVASLGILSAAATLTFKKGEPIQLLLGAGAALLSGAFFPITLFPRSVRLAAELLPTTHALEAARMALSRGYGLLQLGRPLLVLAAMTALLLPLSLWCFEAAVTSARRSGTLVHY